MGHWVRPLRAPGTNYSQTMLQNLEVQLQITATDAPWPNGLVEKQKQILVGNLSAAAGACQLSGDAAVRIGAACAATAKNRHTVRENESLVLRAATCGNALANRVVHVTDAARCRNDCKANGSCDSDLQEQWVSKG